MTAPIPVLVAPGAFPSTQNMRAFADAIRGTENVQVLVATRLDDLASCEIPPAGQVVVVAPTNALLPVLNRLPRGGRTLRVHALDPSAALRAPEDRLRRMVRGDGSRSDLHCLRVESNQLQRPWRALAVRAGRAAELGAITRDAAARTTFLGRAVTSVRGIARQLDRNAPAHVPSVAWIQVDGGPSIATPEFVDLRAEQGGLRVRAANPPAGLSLEELRNTLDGLRLQPANEVRLVTSNALLLDTESVDTSSASDWRVTSEAPITVWT